MTVLYEMINLRFRELGGMLLCPVRVLMLFSRKNVRHVMVLSA